MIKPDISVIVPCYNADRYLSLCLASLHAQRQPQIEMILIDDGSTDATGAILDQFARIEPRARVIHVTNRGVSAARNLGIEAAQGRYLAFLDGDDAWEADALSILWRAATRSGAQIVSAGHTIFDMNTNRRIPVEIERTEDTPAEIVQKIIHMHRIYNNLWNKLYARALFDNGEMRLDEGVRIGEDALLNLALYHRARRVVQISERTYVYRVHRASAMANITSYREAHEPMLQAMGRVLIQEGIKELYFRDFLGSVVWINEKEEGIRSCMRRFNRALRPLILESLNPERIPHQDRLLFHAVRRGYFPAWYVARRIRQKLSLRRGGQQ